MVPFLDVAAVLDNAAQEAGVSRALVRAVAWVESRWTPDAVSPAGAVGLMQLMPATWQAPRLEVSDPYNAEQNARGGARYLRRLLEKFRGSEHRALAAYNWGPARVKRTPDPSDWPMQVRRYVQRVQQMKMQGVSPEMYVAHQRARAERLASAEPASSSTSSTSASSAEHATRPERSEGKIDRGNVVPLSSSPRASSRQQADSVGEPVDAECGTTRAEGSPNAT